MSLEIPLELAHVVGNQSVKVVEMIGEESVKAVPVISAVLLTLLLLLLRNIIAKLWYSRKETMKRQGETPEGNVDSASDPRFPKLPWLTICLLYTSPSPRD